MESPPFIPNPPSSTSSNDSYFAPQICANHTLLSPELDLHTIYCTQRSHPYPQPVQMSSNASINLSNVSPAELLVPLLIPRLATPAAPAMSPRTTQSTLATNADINAELLRTIANGLLTTIANCETDTAMQYRWFTEQIQLLQDHILHYEETFERAPEGYMLNDGHIPHFCIPHGDGLSCPAKWIKLNNDGTALGYANTNGPSTMPHIIDLYTQPDDQYNEEGESKPTLPIPMWFRHLLVGPTADFQLLHNALVIHNDWGLTCEVHHYHNLNTKFANLCVRLEHLQVELDAIQQACHSCESRLQLARAPKQVDKLQNIPHKPQALR